MSFPIYCLLPVEKPLSGANHLSVAKWLYGKYLEAVIILTLGEIRYVFISLNCMLKCKILTYKKAPLITLNCYLIVSFISNILSIYFRSFLTSFLFLYVKFFLQLTQKVGFFLHPNSGLFTTFYVTIFQICSKLFQNVLIFLKNLNFLNKILIYLKFSDKMLILRFFFF